MSKTIPSKLYKYQSYNAQNLDNLKNRQIWFSKPENFNDPFDCFVPNIKISKEINNDDLKNLYEFFKNEIPKIDTPDTEFLTTGIPNENFVNGIIESGKVMLKRESEKYRHAGVSCFSKQVDNILMWAHYADGHRGFCLEFDTTQMPFKKAFDVIYLPSYPLINPADTFIRNLPVVSKALFGTKSEHWAYEEEWRIMNNPGNQICPFEPSALTGVYFGCAMPSVHEEIVVKILAKYPPKCYFKMRPSNTDFKVVIENYIMPRSTF